MNKHFFSNPYEIMVIVVFVAVLFIGGMYAYQKYTFGTSSQIKIYDNSVPTSVECAQAGGKLVKAGTCYQVILNSCAYRNAYPATGPDSAGGYGFSDVSCVSKPQAYCQCATGYCWDGSTCIGNDKYKK